MKCDGCIYSRMCHLQRQYHEMVSTCAQLTGTHEPFYSTLCKRAADLFDACIHYEPKP